MPELVRLYDLDLGTEVRDAVFIDEEHILFTTPWGNVRTATVGPGRRRTKLLLTWWRMLPQIARAIGAWWISPRVPEALLPRVAASAASKLAAVNTHDMVIFILSLAGRKGPALTMAGWGEYEPRLGFSPDGEFLAAQADHLYLLDMRLRHTTDYAVEASDWHPAESRMLVLDYHDRLSWIDAGPVSFRQLGTIERPETTPDAVGLAVSADRGECVIAWHTGRLEWWALEPTRLLEVRDSAVEGEAKDGIDHVVPSPDRSLLAVLSLGGLRLWDARTRQPLGERIPDVLEAAFSPSGRRMVVLSGPDLESQGLIPSLWEVRG